jgi:DNA-binding response OmpR family regulator
VDPTPRILLIEDDLDLGACLGVVLEEVGYLVTVATNGSDALAACRQAPALVLVDYYLPGEPSGADLVRALRDATSPSTRVLIMSAEREVQSRAEEAGADGYLEKPFDIDVLLRTVERQVGPEALQPVVR